MKKNEKPHMYWLYYFLCALAWIAGWPILLFLEVREHLRKEGRK